jgi:hypothetical protein
MKKFGFIIFILALITGVIVANLITSDRATANVFNFPVGSGISGSGNVETENRRVDDFRGIDVGGAFHVEITAQKDFGVELEADDNILRLIKTEVKDGILHLSTIEKISTGNPIRVRISAPDIENLDVSGASKVSLADLNNQMLNIDASGASKVSVEGNSVNLKADVSGASKVNARNLITENASVEASGASSVSVFATIELKTDASGASSIDYSGTPKNLLKKTSGASSVKEN